MRLPLIPLIAAIFACHGQATTLPQPNPSPGSSDELLRGWMRAATSEAGLSDLRSTRLPPDHEQVRLWLLGGWAPPAALILTRERSAVQAYFLSPDGSVPHLTDVSEHALSAWRLIDLADLATASSLMNIPIANPSPSAGSVMVSCNDCVVRVLEWRHGATYDSWIESAISPPTVGGRQLAALADSLLTQARF